MPRCTVHRRHVVVRSYVSQPVRRSVHLSDHVSCISMSNKFYAIGISTISRGSVMIWYAHLKGS